MMRAHEVQEVLRLRADRCNRNASRRGATARVLGVAFLLVMGAAPAALAQKSTEQFIPIGKSPGISEKVTAIGTLVTVKPLEHLFTVSEAGGRRNVRMNERTLIWLDRSALKLPNIPGSYADIQPGRRVEVKFVDPIRRDTAEWIKVEVPR